MCDFLKNIVWWEWLSLGVAFLGFLALCFRGIMISAINKPGWHAFGVALKRKDWVVFVLSVFGFDMWLRYTENITVKSWLGLALLLLHILYILWVFRRFVKTLRSDNRRKDSLNNVLQIAYLIGFGVVLVYAIVSFNITEENSLAVSLGAAVMGLVFSNAIRGAVAYIHFRMNNLLRIGDHIEVPNHNVDGEITDISLMTVTVRNWDGTESNVSILELQESSFQNNQKVRDGKTTGRRMRRSFRIDVTSIKELSAEELKCLEDRLKAAGQDATYIFQEYAEHQHTTLNIHLYRRYLHHWLMNNRDITREPCLMVRLREQASEGGVPLQVYTFIRKSGIMSYEEVQSSVMEHMLMTLSWFGLKLYQKD
ncbi:MAG: mechanosensitive ion channel [Alistipes sp.]|nr:mechanosensitive ion channel [Alistipes sp.]